MEFNRVPPAPTQSAEGRPSISRVAAVVLTLPLILAAAGLIAWQIDQIWDR